MGHFSKSCALTGLPITGGASVYAIPVKSGLHDYRTIDDGWVPWGGMIEGKYDDYGGVEEVVASAFVTLLEASGLEVGDCELQQLYDGRNELVQKLAPNFSKAIIMPELSDYQHIATLEEAAQVDFTPLTKLGITIDPQNPLRFIYGDAAVEIVIQKIAKDYEIVICHATLRGKNATAYDPQFNSLSSVAGQFAIIAKYNDSRVVVDGIETVAPALSLEEWECIRFASESDTIFIHKDAFDAAYIAAISETQKYSSEIDLSYAAADLEKYFTRNNPGGIVFELSEKVKHIAAQEPEAYAKNKEKFDERIEVANQEALKDLQSRFKSIAALSVIIPEQYAEWATYDHEEMHKLCMLKYFLMAQGRSFCPPANTVQDGNYPLSELLLSVANEQFEKIKN